jgi:hypothetical protein
MAFLASEHMRRRIEDDLKKADIEALLKRMFDLEKKLGRGDEKALLAYIFFFYNAYPMGILK